MTKFLKYTGIFLAVVIVMALAKGLVQALSL